MLISPLKSLQTHATELVLRFPTNISSPFLPFVLDKGVYAKLSPKWAINSPPPPPPSHLALQAEPATLQLSKQLNCLLFLRCIILASKICWTISKYILYSTHICFLKRTVCPLQLCEDENRVNALKLREVHEDVEVRRSTAYHFLLLLLWSNAGVEGARSRQCMIMQAEVGQGSRLITQERWR